MPDLSEGQSERFKEAALAVADEMTLKRGRFYWPQALSDINDHPGNTRKQLADWFAKTIEKLGYNIS